MLGGAQADGTRTRTLHALRGTAWGGRLAGLALMVAGAGLLVSAAAIPAKAALGQVLLERAFNEAVRTGAPVKPWPWADTWPVARIDAPRLGQHAIVLHGASGEAMAWGPGWVDQSPRPGQAGASIIAAHRDTHFAFLKHLEPGDAVEVTGPDGARQSFTVTHAQIVRHDRSGIEPWGGPARLALVTCYPFDAVTPGPLRYVVFAEADAALS